MRLLFVNSLAKSFSVSRAPCATDISWLVTGLVTVSDNRELCPELASFLDAMGSAELFSELLISQIIVPIELLGSRIRLSPDYDGLMFSRPDCIKMCMEQLMLHCTAKLPARFALNLTS